MTISRPCPIILTVALLSISAYANSPPTTTTAPASQASPHLSSTLPFAANALLGSPLPARLANQPLLHDPQDRQAIQTLLQGIPFTNNDPDIQDPDIQQLHRDIRAWQNREYPDFTTYLPNALGADAVGLNVDDQNRITSIGYFFKNQPAPDHQKILAQIRALSTKLKSPAPLPDPYQFPLPATSPTITFSAFHNDGPTLYLFTIDPIDWYLMNHPDLPPQIHDAIARRRYIPGMTPAQGLLINDGPGKYRMIAHTKGEDALRDENGQILQPKTLTIDTFFAKSRDDALGHASEQGYVVRKLTRIE